MENKIRVNFKNGMSITGITDKNNAKQIEELLMRTFNLGKFYETEIENVEEIK